MVVVLSAWRKSYGFFKDFWKFKYYFIQIWRIYDRINEEMPGNELEEESCSN